MIKISLPPPTELTYKEIVEQGKFGWYRYKDTGALFYMHEDGAVVFGRGARIPHLYPYTECMTWTQTYEFVAREINITLEMPK